MALFFHAGNAQMWFYAIMVWTMLMLCAFLTRRVLFSKILQVTGALLIALALMSPLLLAQGFHASGLDRRGGIGIDIFPRLWAMFLPGALFETPDSGLGGNERYLEIYFSGGLFVLIGFLTFLYSISKIVRVRLSGSYFLA